MDLQESKVRLWLNRLSRYEESGLTVARFCGQEKLSIATFYYWRRRLVTRDRSAVPVRSSSGPLKGNRSRCRLAVGCKEVAPPQASCQQPILSFTLQVDKLRLACQADSLTALTILLDWAARQSSSVDSLDSMAIGKFQSLVVR